MTERKPGIPTHAEGKGIRTKLVDMSTSSLNDKNFTSLLNEMKKAGYVSLNGHSSLTQWVRVSPGSVLTHDYEPNKEDGDHLQWLDFEVSENAGLVAEKGEVVGLDMGKDSFAVVSPRIDMIDVERSEVGAVLVVHASTPVIARGGVDVFVYGRDHLDPEKNSQTAHFLKELHRIRMSLKDSHLGLQTPNMVERKRHWESQDEQEFLLRHMKQDAPFKLAIANAS